MWKRIISKLPSSRTHFLQGSCSQLSQIEKIQVDIVSESETKTVQSDDSNQKSILEPLSESEDISHISTYLKPTFNFAAYANKSEIIQELVKLGTDFHYIERKVKDALPFMIKLNFNDIKEHILLFNNLGVSFEEVGRVVTKNPFILKESLEDLEVRINYLKFKKFTEEMIARIISKNPFWLSNSTQEIDDKLGYFQKNFDLSGKEVRQVATMKPQLITFHHENVKVNIFALKAEMGFSQEDVKRIILSKPAIFMSGHDRLLKTFEYLHNVMKVPHESILELPQILTCREIRLKQRYQFLVKLRRNQLDPRKPNYINLITMVSGTDAHFATEVAKSSVDEFNMFLKSL